MGPASTLSAPWQHSAHTASAPSAQPAGSANALPPEPGSASRVRDWAEIQERMLAPLVEAVYGRLDVGPGTRLLGLGCGSGLALLMAASRGASVQGHDDDGARLELARQRLRSVGRGHAVADAPPGTPPGGLADTCADCDEASPAAARGRWGLRPAAVRPGEHDVVTLFELYRAEQPGVLVARARRHARRGGQVVLTGWGPRERCETGAVLELSERLARTGGEGDGDSSRAFRLSAPGALERLALTAGLRPEGGGRINCPFAYPDMESAVRGLRSTGLFDPAARRVGDGPVAKEIEESLHGYARPDGTVRMSNVFRYVIARSA
ncbi:hypothetical protein BIV57_14810 [Mangrovactinospora gilvigrisea]|uniref:SAM-dependent methyltransferase n=1 Tax=Mangrovactinospora gilvigrisea TaxID=1428644 RepID=A0A1J7C596_9ACTN|nr:hypothetical protein [Mangrovactinospora gilvigrisea]OIV36724.1 hypothetical protein BIV57_14810 [Mangrovactinospora gilvigrisea]